MDKRTYHNKKTKKTSYTRGFNDHAVRGIQYDFPDDYHTHQCEGNRDSINGLTLFEGHAKFDKNWEANT